MRFELKKYRGVIFYDTEVMQNGIIGWTVIRALNSEKLYNDGLFLSKACNVTARKLQRNYVS